MVDYVPPMRRSPSSTTREGGASAPCGRVPGDPIFEHVRAALAATLGPSRPTTTRRASVEIPVGTAAILDDLSRRRTAAHGDEVVAINTATDELGTWSLLRLESRTLAQACASAAATSGAPAACPRAAWASPSRPALSLTRPAWQIIGRPPSAFRHDEDPPTLMDRRPGRTGDRLDEFERDAADTRERDTRLLNAL